MLVTEQVAMQRTQLRHRVRAAVQAISTPPSALSLYERNARYVMIDGLGVGLVAGVATFLSVFLARLGASNVLVGLLTAMPAITGALLAIPIGQFLGRQANIVTWYARSRVWVLSSYALTGLVPFVFREYAPAVIIAIWAIATIPQTMVNITFTLVMSGVAGPNKRMELMSRRWTTLGISNALSVAAVGWALEQSSFPLNYQIVFICSFIGGLISYYFSTNIVLPHGEPSAVEQVPWRTSLSQMFRLLKEQRPFTQFVLSQFVFRCGMAMAIPLFPLYWVRVVQASDSSIGLINTVQSGVLLVAYSVWIYFSRRWGEGYALTICAFGLALYPLLTATSTNVWQLLIYAAIAGVFVAGTDLVIFDVLLGTAPEHARGSAVGLYHTTNYLATFGAPLLGTALANYVGIGTMLLVAAGLRLLGGLLFLGLGVGRHPRPGSPST
jgi:Na+/melibiose symporter-like transporter